MDLRVSLHDQLGLFIEPCLEQVNLFNDLVFDLRHYVADGVTLGDFGLVLGVKQLRVRGVAYLLQLDVGFVHLVEQDVVAGDYGPPPEECALGLLQVTLVELNDGKHLGAHFLCDLV